MFQFLWHYFWLFCVAIKAHQTAIFLKRCMQHQIMKRLLTMIYVCLLRSKLFDCLINNITQWRNGSFNMDRQSNVVASNVYTPFYPLKRNLSFTSNLVLKSTNMLHKKDLYSIYCSYVVFIHFQTLH